MRSLLLLFPILAVGCTEPDTTGVRIIGHGGQGAEGQHPMNSREALLGGLNDGFDGIEMDVQMTADGVLVAYHDQELKGNPPCIGLVNSMTWAELSACGPMVRVDSLIAEALMTHPDAEFTLDFKLFAAGEWSAYLEAFSGSVASMVESLDPKHPLLIECQVPEFLDRMKGRSAKVDLYLYATETGPGIISARRSGYDGITVELDAISEDEAAEARAAGLQLTLFGIRGTRSLRRALRLQPDRIQSDVAVDRMDRTEGS